MLRRLFEDSRAVPSIKLSDQDSSRFFRDFFGIVKRLLKIGSIFGLINWIHSDFLRFLDD